MKYETRLIWVLGITFGFVFFDRNAVNFLMPFIAKDLAFTNSEVGLIASALSFTWAIAGFFGGAYADRSVRRKRILVAAVIAFSVCSFLSGIAGSFLALFATRLLMGIAEGPILPVSQSLVAFESADGHSPGQMSILMSVLGLSAAFFSFVVPGLSDRLGRRTVVIAFNLIGAVVPAAVLYFDGSAYALAALVFLGWSASGTMPLLMGTIPSETIPARYVATALGMVMGLGEVLGGVGAPAVAGWTADRYSLQVPLYMQAGCAVIAAALALFLIETAPARLANRAAPALAQ
jgi:MFS family permease